MMKIELRVLVDRVGRDENIHTGKSVQFGHVWQTERFEFSKIRFWEIADMEGIPLLDQLYFRLIFFAKVQTTTHNDKFVLVCPFGHRFRVIFAIFLIFDTKKIR